MFNKSSTTVVFLFLILNWQLMACCADNTDSNVSDSDSNSMMDPNATIVENKELDLKAIMNHCNESFRITMDYLAELNATGMLQDESDKTPMCFLRCYLENVGILTEKDDVNKERAVEMLWTTSESTVEDCMAEMKGSACQRAYYLVKCVMTRALVDGRTNEDE